MQKYHDEPKQYKGYLKSALTPQCRPTEVNGGTVYPASQKPRAFAAPVHAISHEALQLLEPVLDEDDLRGGRH